MDEKWSAALNGLEAVWQRVSAQNPVRMPAPAESARRPDAAALLRGFLADESARSAQYAAAARSAPSVLSAPTTSRASAGAALSPVSFPARR